MQTGQPGLSSKVTDSSVIRPLNDDEVQIVRDTAPDGDGLYYGYGKNFKELIGGASSSEFALLVAEVTGAQINAEPAAIAVTLNFPGTKPSQYRVHGIYMKMFKSFVSPTRDIFSVKINQLSPNFTLEYEIFYNAINIDNAIANIQFGASLNVLQDFRLDFGFDGGGVNPQDYNADALVKLYIIVSKFPILQ